MLLPAKSKMPKKIIKYFTLFMIFWSVILIAFFTIAIINENKNKMEKATIIANQAINSHILFRKWIAQKGGIYAPVDKNTPPNPYLDAKEKNIKTPSGKKLTLMNPAYVTRQLFEIEKQHKLFSGHITSLKPLRPANKPDKWETRSLKQFEHGKKETHKIVIKNDKKQLRLMIPLKTKKSCLKCHAKQGYKLGDIRGGISEYILMEKLDIISGKTIKATASYLFIIWIIGNILAFIFAKNFAFSYYKQESYKQQLLYEKKKFEDIATISGDWLWEIDNKGDYTFIQGSVEKTLGYSINEMLGKHFIDFMEDSNSKDTYNKFSEIVKKRKKITNLENWKHRKDGKLVCLLTNATPIIDENNELLGYRGVDKDITETKQLTDKLLTAIQIADISREKAEIATKANAIFLANMSHEIRTPMNAIIGMTNLALESKDKNEQKDFLKTSLIAANNLLKIINDILDLSKIEANQMQIEDAPFILDEMKNYIFNTLNSLCEEKHIDFTIIKDNNLQQYYRGDYFKIQQVLINLIGNALKFTPKNGKITISFEKETGEIPKDKNKDLLKISVSDTGIGIPEDKLDLIFESFSQANITTHRKYGGTGLGLTISKKIIEQLGGKIEVKSKIGQGTTFIVYIPLVLSKAPIDKKKNISSTNKLTKTKNRQKILLTEDNPLNQKLASAILKKFDHDFKIANDGTEALKILTQENFDLILMDIEMPEMDGYETTERIRNGETGEQNKEIPIIAMSAHVLQEMKEKAKLSGMNDFITKPIDFRELQNKIELFSSKK